MDENAIFSTKSFHNPMASSHPLISTIVTLYTLIFLYFPNTSIILSPLVISTSLLLLSLLRLGAAQRKKPEPQDPPLLSDHDDCAVIEFDPDPIPVTFYGGDSFVKERNVREVVYHDDPVRKPDPEPYFVEWNVRAPLEVIYEAYEEEEEELGVIERYASLSMYYPETDTDSSSEDSPENVCFRWDDEEDKEGLIEIELDHCKRNSNSNSNSEVDEDNLIEIDLNFPAT